MRFVPERDNLKKAAYDHIAQRKKPGSKETETGSSGLRFCDFGVDVGASHF